MSYPNPYGLPSQRAPHTLAAWQHNTDEHHTGAGGRIESIDSCDHCWNNARELSSELERSHRRRLADARAWRDAHPTANNWRTA